MKRFLGAFLLLVASVAAAGVAAPVEDGKIHACTDAGGNVVYLGEPCPEAAPGAPKPVVAPKPVAPKPPTKSKSRTRPPAPSPSFTIPKPPVAVPKHPQPQPIDAHGNTPEVVIRSFVSAVTAGNRAAALSCLTSSALIELGPDAAGLPMDELLKTVSSFTGYVNEGDVGPFWSIRALRTGTRPKWIFLEQTPGGDWKISAF